MNIYRAVGILLAVSLVATGGIEAGWDEYQESSLRAVIEQHDGNGGTSDLVFTPGVPYRVEVVFSGRFRDILPARALFIELWLKSNGLDPALKSQFYTEMRVMEGQTEYWLPVQKTLVPHLKKECAKSKPVTLFVVWPGKTGADWVFLVNEFDAGHGAEK
jgi:hypothetical protein